MELSLGFLVVLILILFPGLLYRRLYFYGEFSKEFNAGHSIASLLAISTIPGITILIVSFVLYRFSFQSIDIAQAIDKFKDINNPEYRLSNRDITFNDVIETKVAAFLGFEYLISLILGTLLGRLVRITRLDNRFKILRFKNYWFYIFNGQHDGFKKFKHFVQPKKKHLFTKVDILVDSSGKPLLYSGIIVDYELSEKDNSTLSKVYLQNAERYSEKDGRRKRVEIPGTLLVVDCSSLKNINLTYIYEETKDILKSKTPGYVDLSFGLLYIFLIPFFIFKTDSVNSEYYNLLFNTGWLERTIIYFLIIQLLNLFNPYIKLKDEYKYVDFKTFFFKLIWIGFMSIILWFIR